MQGVEIEKRTTTVSLTRRTWKLAWSAAVGGEDMEDWNALKTCLLKNAENVCGVTKGPPKRKIPWWWNA